MNKIYVGNLPYEVTEEDLESTFGQFGGIESVALIIDRQTGRSKGFGFITFNEQKSAQDSLALDGTDLKGRNLRVNIATEKPKGRGGDDRGGRSGGGGGGGRW